MGQLKILILCLVLVIIVLVPDVIVESLHGLLEFLIELAHTVFEIVEVTLDTLIEHAFHTDLHQTQIIVFYILALMVFYGLLRFCRAVPIYYRRCRDVWRGAKAHREAQAKDYWHNLAFLKKAQLTLLGITFFTGVFFLLFM
ncbi:MAG: hypothetical protein HOP02_07960 [Methylococcaceae bacterium]|nr:hypothetical protein [Methylococcaceae bacterium]